ncbi:MAG: DUF3817 domain-containing protein [Chryseolinea sp.]
MIGFFRKISIAEGISLLMLLFIAMPLKYLLDMPTAVKIAGWIHGLLFVVYVSVLLVLQFSKRWSFFFFVSAFLASLLPFGTFVLDKHLRDKELAEKIAE